MKMLTKSFLLVFWASISVATAQKSDVLLTVDKKPVTLEDFENIYKKNNPNPAMDKESLDNYLELFINFKLKVREAEELGMDTVPKFIKELAGYRKQLAQPYLVDQDMTKQLIDEAYARMKKDVSASHILVRLAPDASPEDTLAAFKKITNLRNSIKSPEQFESIAKEASEDPSAKDNGGYLGYFSAFQMVYPFETAAYKTNVGEVSQPIRTRFGYHLVYVKDRRPARGQIKSAHIMVRTGTDADEKKIAEARKKIDEIRAKIKTAEDFEKMARVYSEDKNTSARGGILPVFGTGRMVPEFEEAAFALTEDGAISEPVQTPFGWHLIKRIELIQVGEFDEMENEIKTKVTRDGRGVKSVKSMVAKLKSEYKYKATKKSLDPFYSLIDSTYFQNTWDVKKADNLSGSVFRIQDKKYSKSTRTYTQKEFAEYLAGNMRKQAPQEVRTFVNESYEKFVEEKILEFEDSNLEAKYPEFRALIKEYRDGILLFELMDQKVWTKAISDSSGLANYFEDNKGDFTWKDRVEGNIYFCNNSEIANQVREMVQTQSKMGFSDDSLLTTVNKESLLNLRIESGKFEKEYHPVLGKISWSEGLSNNLEQDGQTIFVKVNKVLGPEGKELDECRGLVTAQYQTYLEDEWIKTLRSKYSVEVDKSVLEKLK